jgi:hypothetical protein
LLGLGVRSAGLVFHNSMTERLKGAAQGNNPS